ncbi:MAG TPA: hypothetical protein VFT62_07015 [Mycobacteriales bacterium]|nr:hypothetical protein [Mycobacteriales bacterium]
MAEVPDPENAAGRWLAVSISWERAGRIRLAGRVITELVTNLLAGGWAGGIPAKRRSEIVVRRRDNGAVVATFDHDYEPEVLDHLASLQERLVTLRLWDFCRDVGIRYELVDDAQPMDAQ